MRISRIITFWPIFGTRARAYDARTEPGEIDMQVSGKGLARPVLTCWPSKVVLGE